MLNRDIFPPTYILPTLSISKFTSYLPIAPNQYKTVFQYAMHLKSFNLQFC